MSSLRSGGGPVVSEHPQMPTAPPTTATLMTNTATQLPPNDPETKQSLVVSFVGVFAPFGRRECGVNTLDDAMIAVYT